MICLLFKRHFIQWRNHRTPSWFCIPHIPIHTATVIRGAKLGYTSLSLIDVARCDHIDEGHNLELENHLAFGYFGRQILCGTKRFAIVAKDFGGHPDKPNIIEPQTTHNRIIGGRGD